MDLISLVKEQLTGNTISEIGNFLGESPEAVGAGLTAALPTVLGGIMEKSSTTQGASNLLNILKNDTVSKDFFSNLGNFTAGGNLSSVLTAGSGILSSLFGDKISSIVKLVSSNSGLKTESSSTLLNLAGPLLIGALSKKASADGFGVSGLASFLMGQKDFVKSALPSGIGSILNVNALGDFLGNGNNGNEVVEEERKGSFLPWLLLILLVLGGVYFWKSCQNKASDVATVVEDVKDTAGELTDSLERQLEKTLSTGVKLNFSNTSIENEMIGFIEDGSKAVDKDTWFNFRKLTFEQGSAVIDSTSEKEVDNIAEILKAYPAVNIKVGGYTDNTGSDAINIKLSTERAANVVAALVKRGIAASRLESEGYGPKHPIASNDTVEGQEQNRRIAVRITKK